MRTCFYTIAVPSNRLRDAMARPVEGPFGRPCCSLAAWWRRSRTSLREWAYARAYLNSTQRAKELPFFLHRHNWHGPHAGIAGKSPISTIGLNKDNLFETPQLEHPQAPETRVTG